MATPWYHQLGNEKYTKGALPPAAPAPGPNATWLLPGSGRIVRRFLPDKGPHRRIMGYRRANGARAHAGLDLYAKKGDEVVAIDDGVILSFYYYFAGTFALFVDHGQYTVNYGEVDKESLKHFGLTTPVYRDKSCLDGGRLMTAGDRGANEFLDILTGSGSPVVAGQPIALVGENTFRSSMLHVEMYSDPATISGFHGFNKQWKRFPDSDAPDGMFNPESFMIDLSTRAQVAPAREELLPESHCR